MAGLTVPGSGRDDRVRPATRWLSVVIIPFLVVAFAVLYPFPDDTGRLFAWPVKPAMTPMILASVYLGGAYFFYRAVTAGQWHTVKGGFVERATTEVTAALDGAGLDHAPPAVALIRLLDAGWQVAARYPFLW